MMWIGHQNCHKERPAIDRALARGGASISLNEVGPHSLYLETAADYETFHIPGAARERKTSTMTAIMVNRDRTTIGGLGHLAAPASKPDRIAPARWLYGITYLDEGHPLTHLTLHNHAALDDLGTDVDRVRKAAAGLEVLEATLDYLEVLGGDVVVTGDLNSRDHATSPGWRDPGERFRARGWHYRNEGLDWIAWDPAGLVLADFDVIAKADAHSDHPGLLAGFTHR